MASPHAVAEFRAYFDQAPVYGYGRSLEEFMELTPLTVASPQQVIDKTLTVREHFGHCQRPLFLIDHAGLAPRTVFDLEMLVPDAPNHATRRAVDRASSNGEMADSVTEGLVG